ncbi:lipopolysaccharide transport periplasmic protein LptA [Parasedimentitalea marina]|uniref:Lipopolysaccharide transport periplasmic protein LptA n=1 Tax=Parasedimentitalea marina TaxID=2483033 RepID=A0A3T0N7I1_9RHOB|nr:lipopolysaccharide transport periplasmic protein LptA [Parasedimentitalea marina]AZV79994.1 lipopolysaccharide transport periplasmic protein LptA [Parasedimentitalea marina]
MTYLRALIFSLPLALISSAVTAQSASIAFGTIKADPTLPVEVTADALEVNQTDGSAEFQGNVLVIQGVMRLSADTVLVSYKPEQKGIDQLEAIGNVILVNGPDAAEAERAEYTIDSGTVVMTGNVLLSQGSSTLTSNQMVVNLNAGTAQMSGRVKTILNPDGSN